MRRLAVLSSGLGLVLVGAVVYLTGVGRTPEPEIEEFVNFSSPAPEPAPAPFPPSASELKQKAIPSAPKPKRDAPALANAKPAAGPPEAAKEPFKIPPPPVLRRVGPQRAIQVGYDHLDLKKVAGMEIITNRAVEHVPAWLAELKGQRLRIKGYMASNQLQTEDIDVFLLAPNADCPFGTDTICHFIDVHLEGDERAEYKYRDPLTIEGVFRIELRESEGDKGKMEIVELYHLDDAHQVE